MRTRMQKMDRKESRYPASANTLIERLRKTRALSCNPSDVGMDSYLDWLTKYGTSCFVMSRVH